MAVLDSLPGIEVTICVDGEPLREFENPEDDTEPKEPDNDSEVAEHQRSVTVKRFLESAAGQFYTIKCTVQDPYRYSGACTHIVFSPQVDGIYLLGRAFGKDKYEKRGLNFTSILEGNTHREQGRRLVQKFKFVETLIAQDDAKQMTTNFSKEAQSIGEIKVVVHKKMILGKEDERNGRPLLTTQTEIPEKLLKGKAKSHSTLFGDPEATGPSNRIKTAYLDGGVDYPIAIFKFQYGSRENLKSLGVIERSPEPELELESEPKPTPELEPKARSDAEATPNTIPELSTALAAPSSAASPMNFPNLNIHTLDPTQTGQLFGQFLQYLQTQGGIQSAQGPAPPLENTTTAATPAPPTSANTSSNAAAATQIVE